MNQIINKKENLFRRYFKFDQYNAILKKEIFGGISTFLAMAYIIAVNPSIIGASPITPGNSGVLASNYYGGLFLATVISSFIATFIMGLYARIPVALAPGMGLNTFFAFTVAQQVGFDSALTITMLSGICYFIVVITPAREKISQLMPSNLKLAIGTGIGFFVSYVGLQNTKIIVQDPSKALISVLGDLSHPMVILAICLLTVGLILHYSKIPNAIIITMLLGALILIPLILTNSTGVASYNPDKINPVKVGYGDMSTFGDVIKGGWVGFTNINMWKNPITYIGILSFLYMDFFDTTGTLITIDKTIDLSKNNKDWLTKANRVDALSTIVGASIGATTVTSFVESTVGVSAGAKTGFSAIITSLCFGATVALWPVMQVFMPIGDYQPITGPILIIVGTMMISQVKHFDWSYVIDIPVLFITVVFMMLSNSIAYGIAFGTIVFAILNTSLGLFQRIFKNKDWNVNTLEIAMDQSNSANKKEKVDYLKRVNYSIIVISIISLTYIVLQTGITYHNWFM